MSTGADPSGLLTPSAPSPAGCTAGGLGAQDATASARGRECLSAPSPIPSRDVPGTHCTRRPRVQCWGGGASPPRTRFRLPPPGAAGAGRLPTGTGCGGRRAGLGHHGAPAAPLLTPAGGSRHLRPLPPLAPDFAFRQVPARRCSWGRVIRITAKSARTQHIIASA